MSDALVDAPVTELAEEASVSVDEGAVTVALVVSVAVEVLSISIDFSKRHQICCRRLTL